MFTAANSTFDQFRWNSARPNTPVMAQRYRLPPGHLPQSSSASRFTAGACGFLLLIQNGEPPEL
jgi:hypothetical protein